MKENKLMSNLLCAAFVVTLIIFIGCSLETVEQEKDEVKEEIIYNGIKLPEKWPPRYNEPDEPMEMPVPYIKNKPDVIPINIGRQLFVDNFLIAETNLIPHSHKPEFYKGNPVLGPDKDWEATLNGAFYAAPFSDGVWYDETDQKFKMWYLAGGNHLIAEARKQFEADEPIRTDHAYSFTTGYAESKDGKNWEKPILGIYGQTNLVDSVRRDSQTIWLDKLENDPKKRYKMFQVANNPYRGGWQFILKYSDDGMNWSSGEAQSGRLGDRSSAFYNPFRDVWCLSLRYGTKVSGRSRAYLENKDPEIAVSFAHYIRPDVPDKNVVYWITPSDIDPRHPKFPDINPGIYNFDAIAYESIMLGFYSVWQGPENRDCFELGIQKRNEILLGYSRDGFHFSRPFYETFMGVNEEDGAWNWGNMQSINGVPIIVGDSLYFYSSGRMLNEIMWDSHMSTGLATLRRDGFVSMKAGDKEGYLKTEKLAFDGDYFFVNADVDRGQLAVEILDKKGLPVNGFSRDDCVIMKNENSTKYLITWKKEKDLSSLKGKDIRLKFYLTKGDLYAFWISPWKTGESRGYTAGGGPGLSKDGIDKLIEIF